LRMALRGNSILAHKKRRLTAECMVPETVASIVSAHRAGTVTPEQTVARSFERIRAHGDAAIFISLREQGEALAEARRLAANGPVGRPLYGVPVAVKDNIDVAGLPTTAACPAFAYHPLKDATGVARLRQAGAVIIGKTNLDQFATGLVGVRSPYGAPRNLFDPKLIPGGSSSGSAIAVAAGLVPLALGTDTAGSGRVPAAFNNIIGLKPSVGLVPTAGVVPACRTLDCVSVFALTVDDAWTALAAMAGYDRTDPFSRDLPVGTLGSMPKGARIGVPKPGQRVLFGDREQTSAYEHALARFARLGVAIVEIDMEPFYEAARLLYEGPWLAERYITVRALIASSPESIHPVTREIILAGARPSAIDTFAALHRLAELRRVCDHIFDAMDVLVLPTTPTVYTVAQVNADPIELNSRLGIYTNFVNLLDLCGLAVPASLRSDGVPFGVTLLAPAGNDAFLAALGRVFHADTALPLGAIGEKQSPLPTLPAEPHRDEIAIAVVGAHLSGMPLNDELRMLGARLLGPAATASNYRLYLLESDPPRPGLVRVAARGKAIEVEVWALPIESFGRLVAKVPPPLSIGTVLLAGGRPVKGFLCEQHVVKAAQDISHCGGWRSYLAHTASAAVSIVRKRPPSPRKAVKKMGARSLPRRVRKVRRARAKP
jgi:allophanate hydrolase